MNLLAQGAAWLAKQRQEHLSTPVTIVRPGGGSCEAMGMRGRTDAELERGDGYVETTRSYDWKFSPDDYRPGSEPTLPHTGDLVRERDGEFVVEYEVQPLAGQAAYRLTDGYGHTLRVHTRRVRRVRVEELAA